MPSVDAQDATPDPRVVVVTGASAGIGFAVAERRAAAGDRVVITGRSQETLAAALDRLGSGVGVAVDAGAPDAAGRVVAAAMDAYGRVDVIVANAAHIPPPGPLVRAEDEDIDAVWRTNVAAPLRLVRAAWA
ncbi:MAG TPA: SDR family NAD(P)-dependent oxidoreductase, partial [Candidatus Nanopelagicales bacterium]|nr:SDR family NAD(P)-dependent oxidoreductase [Candidatus Nanopelagicales bacterium]